MTPLEILAVGVLVVTFIDRTISVLDKLRGGPDGR